MSMAGALGADPAPDDAPDRLSGFPAPYETSPVLGHDGARAEFEKALARGRMHHGWLMVGPEGIGKATLAYALARHVLAGAEGQDEADDPNARLFQQVVMRAHPNLLVLTRSYNDKTKRYSQWIAVDAVRRLRGFLGETAGQAGWRVVIVDRADELNQNAANALLKALEEPPEKTLFLLVSSAEGRVPVTIRSRCLKLRLEPLGAEDLRRAVGMALSAAGETVEPERLKTALALSEGSVRRALVLGTGEGITFYRDVVAALRALPALDGAWLQATAERLRAPANQEAFALFVSLLTGLIERLVRIAATGEGGTPEERELAERLIGRSNLDDWAELWEALNRSYSETVGLNLDRGLFVLESFFRLKQLVEEKSV